MHKLLFGLLLQSIFLIFTWKTSFKLSNRFFYNSNRLIRWSSISLIFCWLLSVTFSILIPFGLFKPLYACIIAIFSFLITKYFIPSQERQETTYKVFLTNVTSIANYIHENQSLWLPTAIFIFFLALLTTRILALPLLGWDSFTYHGVKAGSWVQTGGWLTLDAPGAWSYYRSFLGGGEVFTAWAMLFLRSDVLAGIPDLFFWIMLGLTTINLGRLSGLKLQNSILVSMAFVCTLEVSRVVGTGYVDNSSSFFLLGGLLFILQFFKSNNKADLCLSFAAFGLASSVKILAYSISVVMIIVILLATLKRGTMTWKSFIICFLLYCAPIIQWLAFNYHITGFILGCIPLKIGPITLGASPESLKWFLIRPEMVSYTLASETNALVLAIGKFGLFLSLILLAIPGFINNLRKLSYDSLLIATMVFTNLILYFIPSFSAARILWASYSGRFLVPIIVLIAIAGLSNIQKHQRGNTTISFLTTISIAFGLLQYILNYSINSNSMEFVFIAIASIVSIFSYLVYFLFSKKIDQVLLQNKALIITTIVSLFIGIVIGAHHFKNKFRITAYKECTFMHDFRRYWLPAFTALKDLDANIAFTYGSHKTGHRVFLAPFIGENFTNKLQYISPEIDGKILPHNSKYFVKSKPNFDLWIARLKQANITHLMTFLPACNQELKWAEKHPEHFTRITGWTRKWGLFKFN